MTDIVTLLREAAIILAADAAEAVRQGYPGEHGRKDFADRLAAAADELEASAEWALCKWLAEDQERRCQFLGGREWCGALWDAKGSNVHSEATDRAAAIRAAIKAWGER